MPVALFGAAGSLSARAESTSATDFGVDTAYHWQREAQLADPITTTTLALGGLAWILGGVTGNASDRVFCSVFRGVRARVAGLRGLPENHDVARAVRIAQMQALERVIRDFRERRGRPEWMEPPRTREFFERGLAFCAQTVGRSRDITVRLNIELTESLLATVDGILAPPPHDGLARDRVLAVASSAEDAVLAELRTTTGAIELPPGLEDHFRDGAGSCSRFLELFGAYISEQIKESEPFRAILTSGQLSRIEARHLRDG